MLQYQLEYAAWANRRILNAAGPLTAEELTYDFKSSERSILGTLVHIYRADRIWLARMNGELVDFSSPGDEALSSLLEHWPSLGERWLKWAQHADENAELAYQDLRGNRWTQPVWQIVHHVVNHATHHRGQAIGFIRTLGHTPPNVDSITFARERL